MSTKKLERLRFNHKYRLRKNFDYDGPPLHYYAKKGEIETYTGRGTYGAHVYGENPYRLILMSWKEAVEYLEEVKFTQEKIKEIK